jgi:hypothetical protein
MDLDIDQYMTKAEDGEDYFTISHLKTEDLVDLAGMMHLHAATMRNVVKWGLDEGEAKWFFAEADKWEERGKKFQAYVDERFFPQSHTDNLRYRNATPGGDL